MQIDVTLDVFKELTLLLQSEADTYSDVIRRLLNLSDVCPPEGSEADGTSVGNPGFNAAKGVFDDRNGIWVGNVFLPNGTQMRATYKSRRFYAEVQGERWVAEVGREYHSPSEAACAISGTNVNGWRFWYAKRPEDNDWRRLDEFRR